MNYRKLKLTLFLIAAYSISSLHAQFQLQGTARTLVDDCFELTPAQDGSVGAVWFTPKINLRESFDITTEFNFGCSDNGADGMAFVLHPYSDALGGGGGVLDIITFGILSLSNLMLLKTIYKMILTMIT